MSTPSDPSRLFDLLERERVECAGLREALTASTELLTMATPWLPRVKPREGAPFGLGYEADAQVVRNQRVLGLAEPEGER
jgi:hypothetical protein